VAPLELWEKVLVNADKYLDTVHGQIACTDCHDGVESSDKETAHEDLIARPSQDDMKVCGDCHPDKSETYSKSLHSTLNGYWNALDTRSVPENHDVLAQAFGNHCSSCHATCGDCHVSQPASVGGGFFNGHLFEKTPPMTRSCTACHGSRVGNEYLGNNEGLPGDVHFREGRMNCVACHTDSELHGQGSNCTQCHTAPEEMTMPAAKHRYGSIQVPSCEACHPNTTLGNDNIEMHTVHGSDLSCEVCHSIAYTSCDGCHVAISEKTGNPYFETEATYSTFLIGKNPLISYSRPYKFVTLRHVPATQDAFSYYGDNLLSNFDTLPTWAYATPHNTQLKTPQTESCNACHGNPALFLTADKVAENELQANASVIIDQIPALVIEAVNP